jgi:hypothetical protein
MNILEQLKNLTEEQKKELISYLQAPEKETKPKEKKPAKIDSDFKVTKEDNGKRRSQVKAGKNTFTDDGTEKGSDGIVYTKSPRTRPEAKSVTIKCSVCQRDVTIPASLERGDYYRCERCVG